MESALSNIVIGKNIIAQQILGDLVTHCKAHYPIDFFVDIHKINSNTLTNNTQIPYF